MEELITSYLVQKRECNLLVLGHFRIKTKPADFEKVNNQIFPPTDEILYSEFAANISEDLISYVSRRQQVTRDEAEGKINSWCNYARQQLDQGEKIIFNSIGSLQKDAVGNIFFQRKKGFSFYGPVAAENIINKNVEHPALAGNKETASATNEFYREEIIPKKPLWKIAVVVLLGISLLVLLFYFYTHELSETGIGNQASFPTADPPTLHRSP